MAQGDKLKKLNKNKRIHVKAQKPVRGDQQKLKPGKLDLPAKKIEKRKDQDKFLNIQKRLATQSEAMFSNKVQGTGGELNLKYAELTEKPKKKGHK
eukprot:CAMPEP_0119413866 /NCGR_PEP_ID=MMETSP1335-20130426/6150_1 /TAXON_ID=259385 /ORGANISM="Chrysoculter rhomboideus, Strain RCC1486" /LENGTH=95 /DNA_ID=CAMNT_0007438697 /DNA_START=20 /DNA_END=307 /DNA_ORIENTATION=-